MWALSTTLCLFLLAATTAQAQDYVRTFHAEYAFDPEGVFDLTTYKGSIAISPWDHPKVQIDVRIEAEDFDGLLMLPDIEIRAVGSVRHLKVETDYRKAMWRMSKLFGQRTYPRLPLVHYEIKMPRTARLKVDDYTSNTYITDFQADLDFYTYKGEVQMTNFGGTLTLDTFMGTARVAFGSLVSDCTMASREGQIAVDLPGGVGFDLEVNLGTPEAVFAHEVGFAGPVRKDDTKRFRGPAKGDKAYLGPFNGGGARLSLSTHSGSLQLSEH